MSRSSHGTKGKHSFVYHFKKTGSVVLGDCFENFFKKHAEAIGLLPAVITITKKDMIEGFTLRFLWWAVIMVAAVVFNAIVNSN